MRFNVGDKFLDQDGTLGTILRVSGYPGSPNFPGPSHYLVDMDSGGMRHIEIEVADEILQEILRQDTMWMDGYVETPIPVEYSCICDFQSVIMVTGCQCGGK